MKGFPSWETKLLRMTAKVGGPPFFRISRHLLHWVVSLGLEVDISGHVVTCGATGLGVDISGHTDLWSHVPNDEGRGRGWEWRLGDPEDPQASPIRSRSASLLRVAEPGFYSGHLIPSPHDILCPGPGLPTLHTSLSNGGQDTWLCLRELGTRPGHHHMVVSFPLRVGIYLSLPVTPI